MALLDSKTEFTTRVMQLGLGDYMEKFKAAGATTFAELAFLTDYVPGGDAAVFARELVNPILGEEGAAAPKKAPLRRLFTEAYTLAAADLKRLTEPPAGEDGTSTARLPAAERESRRLAIQERVRFPLLGDHDPSFHLLDLVHGMYEDNCLRPVDWSQLTTRNQELAGVRIDKTFKADENGYMKERKEVSLQPANVSTDHLLRCALRRRALAFDMALLADFDTLESWTELMFRSMQDEAPPRYRMPGVEELRIADRALWKHVAAECRSGIRPIANGTRPINTAIAKLMDSAIIRSYLAPLPAPSMPRGNISSNAGIVAPGFSQDTRAQQRIQQLEHQVANLKRSRDARDAQPGKGTGSGRNSSKGKGRGGKPVKGPRVPPQLVGKHSKTANGEPICFNYNINGCSRAPPGGRCDRGWHVCAEPGCGKAHALPEHSR